MEINFKRDFIIAVIIAAAASVTGLITNTIRTPILHGMADRGTIEPATANYYKGVELIDDWAQVWFKDGDEGVEIQDIYYEEAVAIFESGEAVFVDARLLREYREGHIKGAIPWPFNEFVEYLGKYIDDFPPDTPIVVYCEGGSCVQSYKVAESLLVSGYTNISLYHGGFEEWGAMEQPVETGDYE
jgi:rhodanese-related sulfurtransferase